MRRAVLAICAAGAALLAATAPALGASRGVELVDNLPYQQEGSRPEGGPYHPFANFCSAHYFDVEGSTVAYAWYGEGTRFLDISDPANPRQFAYWRPDDTVVWASYIHGGYVYTADRVRGVDVLRLTSGATTARIARREVSAPAPSARQRRFLARLSARYWADPGTSGLCLIQAQ